MDLRIRKFAIALAALELVSALSLPGVFLWPLNALRTANYYMDGALLVASVDVLRILFLVVPVLSLVGAIRGKRWALYGVMIFPAIAFVFGAGAIPYAAQIFPVGAPRTIAITIINLAVVAAAAWLRWGRSNNSFKPNPLRRFVEMCRR